jgi:hypothetical protein
LYRTGQAAGQLKSAARAARGGASGTGLAAPVRAGASLGFGAARQDSDHHHHDQQNGNVFIVPPVYYDIGVNILPFRDQSRFSFPDPAPAKTHKHV